MTRARIMMDRAYAQRIAALFATALPLAVALTTPAACDASKTASAPPASQQAPVTPPPSPSPTPASVPATPPAEKREEAKAPVPAPATDTKSADTKVAEPAPAPKSSEPPVQVAQANAPATEAPTSSADAPKPAAETAPAAEQPKPAAEAAPPAPAPAPAPAPPAAVDNKPAEAPKPAADTTPAAPVPAPSPAADTRDEAKSPPQSETNTATGTKPAEPPKPTSRFSLFGMPVRTWAIQLQNPDPDVIAKTPYDVVVIEYSRDGSADTAFTREEVAKMKRKPDGTDRLLIAYMSIGEAEDYRYYWADKKWSKKANRPSWIMKENPEWRGNYTIKFWNQGWKDIIYDKPGSYLDKLIDAGFDGVYLDKIDITDVLEDYAPKGSTAVDEMVKFVRAISTKANERTGNRFALVASNAEAALDIDAYREVMHAIGKEDMFFVSQFEGGETIDGFPNDPETIKELIRLCKKMVDDNKLVLAVEYLQNKPELIDPTAKKHLALGHIPYFGPRSLARLSGVTYAQSLSASKRGVGGGAGAPSLSATLRKSAASCTGLAEDACRADTSCVWLPGYAAVDVQVPGYCRVAPVSVARRLGVETRE